MDKSTLSADRAQIERAIIGLPSIPLEQAGADSAGFAQLGRDQGNGCVMMPKVKLKVSMIFGGAYHRFGTVLDESAVPPNLRKAKYFGDPDTAMIGETDSWEEVPSGLEEDYEAEAEEQEEPPPPRPVSIKRQIPRKR
jgi:hypothetical protein